MPLPTTAVAGLILGAPARLRDTLRRLPASPLVPALVTVLLLMPLAFRGVTTGPEGGLKQGSPWIFSGDEPHYMVMISSMVKDGDLDLANNYASVHRGGLDAGRWWAEARRLDDHAQFDVGGKPIPWSWVYNPVAPLDTWAVDERGFVEPPKYPGGPVIPPGTPERSIHQPGIAFLLAPVLYPFRDSKYLESVALFCSGLAVVGGFFFFRQLLAGIGAEPVTVNVVSAITFLATPTWFYGRSLFMEGYLVCFVVGAYSLVLVRQRAVLPGLLLAMAIQLKAYTALLAVPLFLDFVVRGRAKQATLLSLPVAAGVGLYLLQNKYLYGGYLTSAQPFVPGHFRNGAIGQLFSPRYGLFCFAPAALAALACWPKFLLRMPRPALVLGGGVLLLYVLMSKWLMWTGAAFGPRYLVPVLPLLFAALTVAGPRLAVPLFGARLTVALAAVSSAITALAVFHYCKYWLTNPALELAVELWRARPTWPTP